VELKVTLVDTMVERGLAEFGLELEPVAPGKFERRNIWFCERVDADGGPTILPLLSRGVLLRIRRNEEDGSGESTVKLRGPEGSVDPKLWRQRSRHLGTTPRSRVTGRPTAVWSLRHWTAKSRLVALMRWSPTDHISCSGCCPRLRKH
jgi:hypothetical protein